MRTRKSVKSDYVEFFPSDLQRSLDADRLAHNGAGDEFIAVRYGPSYNICRVVRVTVLKRNPHVIMVNTDKIYGEGTSSTFRSTTGIEVVGGKHNAARDGSFWRLHAVTPESEAFLAGAESVYEVQQMDSTVRALLAGASKSELAAVIGLITELRRWR